MEYRLSPERYDSMEYRSCGSSGLKLPVVSLGIRHNLGMNDSCANNMDMLFTSFDSGVNQFDAANNYGSEPGSTESNLDRILHEDFSVYTSSITN